MKYSIIIAERNEKENLQQTIKNIKETQKGEIEFIIISDDKGKGPAYCRNAGLQAAKNDICIITDAHMRYRAGALDKQAEYARNNPDSLTCLKCFHNEKMSFTGNPYMAAEIKWKSKIERPDATPQFWVLHGQWRKEKTTGEISCIMGACYALSRSRYIETLKSPLRFGRGWGMDEEMLSIITWLSGGKVEILPLECAHLYRLQPQVPYKMTHENIYGVWANRFSLAYMLPMCDDDRKDLSAWLSQNTDCKRFKEEIRQILDFPALEAQRDYYAKFTRSFDEWKTKYITGDEDMARMKNRTQTMETPAPRNYPEKVMQKTEQEKPGTPCNHCGNTKANKHLTTYANGNKQMKCGSSICGLMFITHLRDI
jgi:glycosyltransferase involved in cell wall biosynthesis